MSGRALLAGELQPVRSFSVPADPEENAVYLRFQRIRINRPKPVGAGHQAGAQAVLMPESSLRSRLDRMACISCWYPARPLHEPIAWGGPIVMNTKEQLRQAFADLDAGTFIAGT